VTRQGDDAGILFRSAVERTFLFYLLAVAAVVGPAVVAAVAALHFWAKARPTAYTLLAAAAVDFAATWYIALALRWVEVTFDGRRVRLGSGIFKTSVPVEDIFEAEAIRPARPGQGELVKLTAAAGNYVMPCRNAGTLVDLIRRYKGSGAEAGR
jgi:hypothetical protein